MNKDNTLEEEIAALFTPFDSQLTLAMVSKSGDGVARAGKELAQGIKSLILQREASAERRGRVEEALELNNKVLDCFFDLDTHSVSYAKNGEGTVKTGLIEAEKAAEKVHTLFKERLSTLRGTDD